MVNQEGIIQESHSPCLGLHWGKERSLGLPPPISLTLKIYYFIS